jgi:hypothetical protein
LRHRAPWTFGNAFAYHTSDIIMFFAAPKLIAARAPSAAIKVVPLHALLLARDARIG